MHVGAIVQNVGSLAAIARIVNAQDAWNSGYTGKGRHTTTARALRRTIAGGCLIDTPGINEVDDEGRAVLARNAAASAALTALGLYPVTQIFQVDEDFTIPAMVPAAYVLQRHGQVKDVGVADGEARAPRKKASKPKFRSLLAGLSAGPRRRNASWTWTAPTRRARPPTW